MSFIGIENGNEFFTQHYLTAIVQGDLRPVLDRWRAGNKEPEGEGPAAPSAARRAPPQALGARAQAFFRYLERMEGESSPEARVAAHHAIWNGLLDDLGYADVLRHGVATLKKSGQVPLFGEIRRADGSPSLWILPVVPARDASVGTLSSVVAREQLVVAVKETGGSLADLAPTGERTVEELVNEAFDLDEPPRFILVLGLDDLVLVERAKWAEQRLLRFDLREILGRRQLDTLDVTAALLHRESLVPAEGIPLLDNLDDSSHKHAFGVSEDLKYALQASIEKLGQAAVHYIGTVKKQKVFGSQGENEVLAEQLSRECLRYMYRLLFLFYIEARPELGYAPMGEDAYRLGYSLERLRDLEQLDLSTDEARNGTYIHRSLRLLFDMIFNGRAPAAQQVRLGGEREAGELTASHFSVFELSPLRSHLFDPARTPLLDGGSYMRDGGVVFTNALLREVIENMSLTRPGKGRRGRISYATLGINQLGAVYEALLSFRGFLAKTELYEVKPEGEDDHDVLDTAYFVPKEDLGKYSEGERVYEADKRTLKRYARGTFIYRLAGRDRQTSASYYTPEVLTRATVKYALKELLEDEGGKAKLPADEILHVTVCEPAMGSAAFLNEAVNQLAEAYLSAKQREKGERIAHDRYGFEKQRVKMFIADNNVFGVDLNPIAVELAEVSLWLNTIHEGGFVPWFTGQTVCGNSLIGARRQVFQAGALRAGKEGKENAWLDAVPDRVPLGALRPAQAVYHFFLGDRSMSVYGRGQEGAPIREMAREALEKIDGWRKEFCAPLSGDEAETMVRLSGIVDSLWDKHADLLKRIRVRTTDPIQVYGQPAVEEGRKPTTTAEKDKIWAEQMLSESVRASSPYRRLKLVMDYWCALWFWPIEQAELLPDREEFLADVAWVLDTDVIAPKPEVGTQGSLFATTAPDEGRQMAMEYGFVDLNKLVAGSARLQLVEKVAKRHRFLHWELEFADVFKQRGGFDLVLGNPPWIPIRWEESAILSDTDPLIVIRQLSALQVAVLRTAVVSNASLREAYFADHEATYGAQSYLSSLGNYPLLQGGIRVNLYKCFLPLAWQLASQGGAAGLLHPEGVYDDPMGGQLRSALYVRLRRHYQFANELELFSNVHHQTAFSINIYGAQRADTRFHHIANLFAAGSIEACYGHAGLGPVPGFKTDENAWSVAGHQHRLIEIEKRELELFGRLYEERDTAAAQARLPAIHSRPLLDALVAFRDARTLADLTTPWSPSPHWHESHAQRDGIIRRKTSFVKRREDFVLSGPHIFVGNPLYKTPREKCDNSSHYDVIDLNVISSDYVPRTNYIPGCAEAEYRERTPKVRWGGGGLATAYYRIAAPAMIAPAGERTLQPAIIPPGFAHLDTIYSFAFEDDDMMLATAGTWMSMASDFFIKSTGIDKFRPSIALRMPVVGDKCPELLLRVLLLSSLTEHYADLWSNCFREQFARDDWAKTDERLERAHFEELRSIWCRKVAFRTDYARRQALVEIDVLVAQLLQMTLEQLRTVYRTQFFVARSYEADTHYDRRGRIIFTNSKGLVGVGLPRTAKKGDPTPAWNDVKDMKSGTVTQTITDDTQPGGPRKRTITYEAPFDRCDRERDYEIAWAHFEKRFAGARS